MLSIADKFLNLTKQLYPTGRAFNIPEFGTLENLHKAIIETDVQTYSDAVSVLNSILPDNEFFTEEDATDWERRLGLITNSIVALEDRMAAIRRKMRYPGNNPAKEHYLYIESQLQLANFPVYVYENRFPGYPDGYVTMTPIELGAPLDSLTYLQHGKIQHGDVQHGYVWNNKIANHIDEELDLPFSVGDNLRSTFYLSGNPIGSAVDIPIERKTEFRQLVLKIKPSQTVAFLLNINFV